MISLRRAALLAAGSGLVAAASLGACSSFTSDDTTAEAGADAPAADAPAPPPPAPPPGPDAPSGPFCTADSGATFCDDFDDPQRTVWTADILTDGGAVAVTDAQAASPPGSLHATVKLAPDSGPGWAYRLAELDAPLSNGFHFEMKVFPVALDSVTPIDIAFTLFLARPDDAGACGLFTESATSQTLFLQGDSTNAFTASPLQYKVVAGKWNTLAVDLGGDGGSELSVSVDGKPTMPPIAVAAPCVSSATFDGMWVGLPAVPGDYVAPVEVFIDDVRLDIH